MVVLLLVVPIASTPVTGATTNDIPPGASTTTGFDEGSTLTVGPTSSDHSNLAAGDSKSLTADRLSAPRGSALDIPSTIDQRANVPVTMTSQPISSEVTFGFSKYDGSLGNGNAYTQTIEADGTTDQMTFTDWRIDEFEDPDFGVNMNDGGPTSIFADPNGDSFQFVSFTTEVFCGEPMTFDVVGYEDGSPVAGASQSYSLSSTGGPTVRSVGFASVDEVRFENYSLTFGNQCLTIDDIVVDQAVSSNTQPSFSNLNANPTYDEAAGTAILVDSDATITDAELDSANDYAGSSLTIAREGGANADDDFGFDTSAGTFTVSSGDLLTGGSVFAGYTESGGELTITFNSNGATATPELVDDVLQSITYRNTADPAIVEYGLTATFDDGDPGGALAVSQSVPTEFDPDLAPITTTTTLDFTDLGPALANQDAIDARNIEELLFYGYDFGDAAESAQIDSNELQLDGRTADPATTLTRFESDESFRLESIDIDNFYSSAQDVTVYGYEDGTLVDSITFSFTAESGYETKQFASQNAAFASVDEIRFTTSASQSVGIDNIVLDATNQPPVLDLDTGAGGTDAAVTFTESDDQGTATGDGVAIAGPVSASDSDGTVDSVTVTLDNPQGDAGEGLAVNTSSLAGDLGFATSANSITITRNTATSAELVAALEAIRFQDASDAPSETARTVIVQITDDRGGTGSATVTVTVVASNDAPTAPDDSSQSTDEDSVAAVGDGAGADLLDLASDPDSGETLSVDQVDGTSSAAGSAVPLDSGATVTVDSDGSWSYDPNGQFNGLAAGDTTTDTFSYTVTDGNGGSDQGTVTITVTGANDAPVAPRDGDGAVDAVSERASNGDSVGVTATSTDPDAGDSVTFALGDDAGGRFQIGAGTGVVTVADATAIDHEATASHTITVRATDGTASSTTDVTISVTDIDETPAITSGTSVSLAEDATNGASVIDVDANVPGGSTDEGVTYALTGGNTGSPFAIDASTGAITVADTTQFDYEGGPTSITLTVTASEGSESTTQSITVTVSDADEPPTFTSGTGSSIDDTASNGATVIDVNASVGGSADQGVNYAITGGNTGSAFSIAAASGVVTVADATAFDSTTSFTLTISAAEGGQTTTQTVSITVADTTPPIADAGTVQTVAEDTSTSFDGSGSTDAFGVTSYDWAFGDGSPNATGGSPTHTYSDPGTYTVTITVGDAAGNTDTDTVTVTVTDTTAPTADAGADQTVDEEMSISFDGTNSADNVGITTYEWDFGDGSANATIAAPSHTYTDPGTYTVTVTTEDAAGNTDTDTVTVTVRDATAPVAEAGANQSVDEDTSVSLDGSGSTDNVGVTSYDWTFGDGSATASGTTQSHTYSDPGTYTVTVTTADAAGNTDVDTLTVTVNDTTTPTADAGGNLTVDEDTAVSFDASGSTDNGVLDHYEWAVGDGSPNATSATPTHTYATPGTYTVTLTVKDSSGNVDVDTLTVTVRDVTTPTADAGANQTVAEDTTVSFDGSGSTDNVGVTTYEWAFGDGSPNATGTSPTHTYATPGTYTVTVTADDAAGNVDTDTLTVTVTDMTTPTALAGPALTVDEDTTVSINDSGSTDNVGITSYEWDVGDGSANATGANTTHTYTTPGTYTVTLTAIDAAGNADTDTLPVTVNDTTAPQVDAGTNQTVKPGQAVSFNGTGSTDNVGITSYEWNFSDGSPNATNATPTHTYTSTGTYVVVLTVEDTTGYINSTTVTVTVQNPPPPANPISPADPADDTEDEDTTPPVANAGPDVVTNDTTIELDGTRSTEATGITAYAWTFSDGDTASGQTVTHTFDTPGTYTANLTITDAAGNQATDSVTITVVEESDDENTTPPDPSLVVLGETTRAGQPVSFDGSNTTDDGYIASYQWDFGDGATATGPTTTHVYSNGGTYTVTLTVTDADGNTASTTARVPVTDLRVTVDPSTTDSENRTTTTIRVENASADVAVNVTAESNRPVDSLASQSNVSVDNIELTVDEPTSYELDVSVRERPTDAAFASETTATALGEVTVSHTVPDSDIDGVRFTVRVRMAYLESKGVSPDSVTLYRLHDGAWTALDTEVVGNSNDQYRFRADSPGLSVFVISAEAADISITAATTDATTVAVGETISVRATLSNDGGTDGTFTANLTIDGDRRHVQDVIVPANESRTVTFDVELRDPGTREVAVSGATASRIQVEAVVASATSSQPPSDQGGPGPSWLWLLVGAAVVVAVTMVIQRRAR